ncbi:hypothetical protein Tco_1070590 [Tanacetum coccineum]|uniref:Uncharacterized protein n=1 Tax=Tanacetum coccineum TaxID=301880 RepID=A0ABQ5HLZ3_9ASTR
MDSRAQIKGLENHGFIGYPFDYRVTLGFGSIAGGLDLVNPIIRLPIEHRIDSGTREDPEEDPADVRDDDDEEEESSEDVDHDNEEEEASKEDEDKEEEHLASADSAVATPPPRSPQTRVPFFSDTSP